MAKNFLKCRGLRGRPLLITSLLFFQSNHSFRSMREKYILYHHHLFYHQKSYLKNEDLKETERVRHQAHQPKEDPMCSLDGGRSYADSYSTNIFHNIFCKGTFEACNQSLVRKLYRLRNPLSQGVVMER